MSEHKAEIDKFLAAKNVAVVGVSETNQGSPANAIYDKLTHAGYNVFPVNRKLETYQGAKCYQSLADIEGGVESVMIVTSPQTTEKVVDECLSNGVQHIWMHNMLGTQTKFGKKMAAKNTSVSDAAVEKAREKGVTVIPGSCPMQHVEPVDKWHKCIFWFNDKFGNH